MDSAWGRGPKLGATRTLGNRVNVTGALGSHVTGRRGLLLRKRFFPLCGLQLVPSQLLNLFH